MVHHILGRDAAIQILSRHFQLSDTGFFQLTNVARGNTTTFFDDHVTVLVLDIEGGNITTQTTGNQLQLAGLLAER